MAMIELVGLHLRRMSASACSNAAERKLDGLSGLSRDGQPVSSFQDGSIHTDGCRSSAPRQEHRMRRRPSAEAQSPSYERPSPHI